MNEEYIYARGKEWQLLKAAEECNELAASILQHVTKGYPEENIQKEMADVEIALTILSTIYGRDIVEQAKEDKMARIKENASIEETPPFTTEEKGSKNGNHHQNKHL